MARTWGLFLTTVLIGLVLAIIAIIPPATKSASAPSDIFSSGRAMKDVRIIAAKPHPTGSPENAEVRGYLQERLTQLGMEVSTTEWFLSERSLKRLSHWRGEEVSEQKIINILGVLPGTDRSKPPLLLMAHHDTVWESPGASDATIGLASILEIVRAVNEDGPPGRDLIVLFTDGEEFGLQGAENFFAKNPLSDKIGAVLNFEARGGGGTTNMFQTSAQNGAAAELYAKVVKQPSASSLSIFVYNALPNDTDLTPALEKDYVAYNLAHIGRAGLYHSPKIDADALEERTLQHMGSQGLDMTRALLAADELPAPKRDATFFDAFGFFTIIYAPVWGWAFLAIALLCFIQSANLKERRDEILSGAARMLAYLLIGGFVLFVFNWLSGADASANYYDRLAAIPKLEVLALLVCLIVAFTIFGKTEHSGNARLGAAVPLLLIGIAGQALAPTATYFLSLSLALCAIASHLIHRWPDNKIVSVIAVILAALVFGYMVMLGHLLLLGVGPTMLPVAILVAAIAVLSLMPFWPGTEKGRDTKMMLVRLGVILALALWIRFDPIASTVPLYSTNLH